MTKILSGAEIAGYMKKNQTHSVRVLKARKVQPKLVIIRDSDDPVIMKYVTLKQRYGADIGVEVVDCLATDVKAAVREVADDDSVHGVIVQLPLRQREGVDETLAAIPAAKDVDGLAAFCHEGDSKDGGFDSATATAINWLIAGYDIPIERLKVAIVGRGRLIGKPLERMWRASGHNVTVFHRGDDLTELRNYDLIVSATGSAHLIKSEMVKPGAYIIDAGTASEDGVLVGDVDEVVRERADLAGITPKIGGVGPLTVAALFEHTIIAAQNRD